MIQSGNAGRRTTVASTHGVQVCVHHLADGPDDGPVVVAAHATGFNGAVWGPFADALAIATGATVVAPDLRGHGRTELPADVEMDWDGFADDVLAVVDELGLSHPVGVGHSKGGAALLRAEARRPGTFAALWCFEPVVFPPELGRGRNDDNPLAAGAERRRDVFASVDEARANYAAKPPMAAFDPRVLDAYVANGLVAVDDADPDGPVRLRCRPAVEAETYRMGTAHNTFEFLGQVRCPTVIAAGSPEPFGPGNFADRIAAVLVHGTLATYPNLGHFGPLTDPDALAADVVAFMAGLPAGGDDRSR
jgi:pimeloyl-ACP methyl ester carboxylesterase